MQHKIEKQFDIQRAQIATAQGQLQKLEAKIKIMQPQKRQTVITDPNKSFVQVIEVKNTRRQLDAQLTGNTAQPIIGLSTN